MLDGMETHMLKFTICFIKQGDSVLLLNRESPSWMGAWNGVGGKIEPNESARDAALREIKEETGLVFDDIQFKGITTWVVDGKGFGGMYVYFAELPPDCRYEVPVKTAEGILDWKNIEWITHPENRGVAYNIPKSIEKIISGTTCFEHRCYYRDGRLIHHEFVDVGEDVEYTLGNSGRTL